MHRGLITHIFFFKIEASLKGLSKKDNKMQKMASAFALRLK